MYNKEWNLLQSASCLHEAICRLIYTHI